MAITYIAFIECVLDRKKVVGGLKKEDSPLISGYQIYHNYIRPHMALDDKTEEKFRKAVFQRKGMKKGNISNALEEAIDLWIKNHKGDQDESNK